MTTGLVAGLLVAAAVTLVVPLRRRWSARRLAALPLPAVPTTEGVPAVGRRHRRFTVDRLRLAAGLAGVAVALVLGGWLGLLVGVLGAIGLDRGLRRLEPASVRARRLAEAAELPLAADLLAVALRGGAPADRATAAVADTLPGPLRERLARVARALTWGAPPAEAWAELAAVPGGARFCRAVTRSAEHGSALAGGLSQLADDLRADQVVAAEATARRAGVWIVLPLGLCFLPAFMLAGLVPVIVAVLGDAL